VPFFDRARSRLPRPVRTLVDWLLTIAVAIGVVLVFEAEVAKPYRVPSASMEPTLHCARPATGCLASTSDRVIVNRLAYRFGGPKRGQIVVFHSPPAAAKRCGQRGDFVKRLIGLPGEVVSERNGFVFFDGKPLHEPYVVPAERDSLTATWPVVPRGRYFFMGDNRAVSCDSRRFGTVARSALVGPVLLTYWPPGRFSLR
jgi:signal peptidase I